VKPGPFAREQPGVDGFLHERVTERVSLSTWIRLRNEDPVVDRLTDQVGELVFRKPGDPSDQPFFDPASGDGGDARHMSRRSGERVKACREDPVQRRRHVMRRIAAGSDELLGEERVPLGALENSLGEVRTGIPPKDRLDLRPDVGDAERCELQDSDPTASLELRQVRSKRVAAVQLVAPEGTDDEHSFVVQVAREEGQEITRRGIGPVKILEHHQRWAVAGEPVEEREKELEEACASELVGRRRRDGCVAARQLGDEPRDLRSGRTQELRATCGCQLARQRPECFHDRPERQSTLAVVGGCTDQHATLRSANRSSELADEPRLPDTGLAGDEDRTGFAAACRLPRRLQGVEFHSAPDEDGTADPSHARILLRRQWRRRAVTGGDGR
jgi:hypothetical protein